MPRANNIAELNEAKEYLLLKLDARDKMSRYLDEALLWAANQIVRISVLYNIEPHNFRFSNNELLKKQVAKILALLREMLYERVKETLTFIDEKEETYYPPILTDKHYDKTLKERISAYANRYEYEVESVIAAALLSKEKSVEKITQSIKKSLHDPWNNTYYISQKGNGVANRLQVDRVSYGTGKTNSAANGLKTVLLYAIIAGFNQNWLRIGNSKGALGFWSFRNSSFPCDTCDEETLVFHYITDTMPPYHPNCVCGMAFVYQTIIE